MAVFALIVNYSSRRLITNTGFHLKVIRINTVKLYEYLLVCTQFTKETVDHDIIVTIILVYYYEQIAVKLMLQSGPHVYSGPITCKYLVCKISAQTY